MWFQDQNFLGLVKNWWKEEHIIGSKMFFFITKLKKLKQKIIK